MVFVGRDKHCMFLPGPLKSLSWFWLNRELTFWWAHWSRGNDLSCVFIETHRTICIWPQTIFLLANKTKHWPLRPIQLIHSSLVICLSLSSSQKRTKLRPHFRNDFLPSTCSFNSSLKFLTSRRSKTYRRSLTVSLEVSKCQIWNNDFCRLQVALLTKMSDEKHPHHHLLQWIRVVKWKARVFLWHMYLSKLNQLPQVVELWRNWVVVRLTNTDSDRHATGNQPHLVIVLVEKF